MALDKMDITFALCNLYFIQFTSFLSTFFVVVLKECRTGDQICLPISYLIIHILLRANRYNEDVRIYTEEKKKMLSKQNDSKTIEHPEWFGYQPIDMMHAYIHTIQYTNNVFVSLVVLMLSSSCYSQGHVKLLVFQFQRLNEFISKNHKVHFFHTQK